MSTIIDENQIPKIPNLYLAVNNNIETQQDYSSSFFYLLASQIPH
jgi:hypothetical protein